MAVWQVRFAMLMPSHSSPAWMMPSPQEVDVPPEPLAPDEPPCPLVPPAPPLPDAPAEPPASRSKE